jgi:hypothetical protein
MRFIIYSFINLEFFRTNIVLIKNNINFIWSSENIKCYSSEPVYSPTFEIKGSIIILPLFPKYTDDKSPHRSKK